MRALRKACEAAGATVKTVAPTIAGVTLAGGDVLPADGQLVGTPAVFFDAVGIVVAGAGCQALRVDSAAADFVANAFVHLKAIAFSESARPLPERAGVIVDKAVVPAEGGGAACAAAAATRQWAREARVRPLR